jgi:beta-phosphoglucomutase-like phosphatase (HAD superfamily)
MFAALALGTPLVSGIPALLDALDAAAIPYAIGSNGPHRKMQVTLGQYPELYARFSGRIFSRHDVAAPKPAPDLYLHAAAALGVASARAVVVEDSPTGARAAARAGMCCYGYAPHDDGKRLAGEGALIFHDMAELPGLLGLVPPRG